MIKKKRSLLALLLVVSLLAGLFSMPVAAAGEDGLISSTDIFPDGEPNGTQETVDPDPEVSTDPETQQTTTTDSITTNWSETVPPAPDGGSDVDPEIVLKEDPDADPIMVPDDLKDDLPEDLPEDPSKKETGSSETTTTTGTETTTKQEVTDSEGNLVSTSTTTTGKETVTHESTSTQKDTYTNVPVGDPSSETITEGDPNAKTPMTDIPDEFTKDMPEDDWTDVPNSGTSTDWTPDWDSIPPKETIPSNPQEVPTKVGTPDSGTSSSITITMTPGGKSDTSTVTQNVYTELLASGAKGLQQEFNSYTEADKDGKKTKSETVYDSTTGEPIGTKVTTIAPELDKKTGLVIGYTRTIVETTYATTTTLPESTTPTPGSQNVAADMDDDLLPPALKSILDNGGTSEETTTDEATGIKTRVVISVQAVTDLVTQKTVYQVTRTTTTEKPDGEPVPTGDPTTTTKSSSSTQTHPVKKPDPVEPVTDEVTGITTTVTYTDLYDTDGTTVIGYEAVTEEKDENGTLLSSKTKRYYNTYVTTDTTVTTVTSTKSTTTGDTTTVTEVITYSVTADTQTVPGNTVTQTKTETTTTDTEKITDAGQLSWEMGETVFKTTESTDKKHALLAISIAQDQWNQNWNVTEVPTGLDYGYDPFYQEYRYDGVTYDNVYYYQPKASVPAINDNDSSTKDNDLQVDSSLNSSWYSPYSHSDLLELQQYLGEGQYIVVGYGQFAEYNIFDDGFEFDDSRTDDNGNNPVDHYRRFHF